MKNYLKYDDTQVFKYDNLVLAVVYTIGHILIAMTCNRIITGASCDADESAIFSGGEAEVTGLELNGSIILQGCLLYTSPSPRDS